MEISSHVENSLTASNYGNDKTVWKITFFPLVNVVVESRLNSVISVFKLGNTR